MVRDNNCGGSTKSLLRPYRSFPSRLYEMVDDTSMDAMISWSESGKSFIVWNQTELCRHVLPKFSLSQELSKFIFMLNTFGFKKVESEEEEERWEYANDDFVRGKPELAEEIHKRYMASLPAKAFLFKDSAKVARLKEKLRALHSAMKERALAKNLSNLTL